MTEDRLTKELRRLAKLLSAAALSVEVIADEVASRQRAEPPSRQGEAARPALAPVEGEDAVEADEPDPTPWEALVEGALTLLREDPKRSWRPAELSRAARDSGVALASLQGVHFGLVARLRQVGAIEEDDAGLHASALLAGQPPEPVEVEPEPAAQAPKVRRELPWAQIVPAAMTLLKLDADDTRWLDFMHFVRAIPNVRVIGCKHGEVIARFEPGAGVPLDPPTVRFYERYL